MKKILLISIVFIGFSCSYFAKKSHEKPVAQVGNTVLYLSDLSSMFKPGITKEDSLQLLKSLVEKWMRRQLILQKAELNLTDDIKNVDKELEEYRTSLIIYKYEQKYVNEKLDTVVGNADIEAYYNQNTSSFTLESNMVKALYIKVPRTVQGLDRLVKLMKDDSRQNNSEIEGFCYQFATNYDYFNDEWISLNKIKSELPINSQIPESTLNESSFFQFSDSTHIYLLKVNDLKLKGTTAPLKSVSNNIKEIIILKRKQKLVNDLENNIYFDAVNKNDL